MTETTHPGGSVDAFEPFGWWATHMDSVNRTPRKRFQAPLIEGLEGRLLMTASAVADIALISATTIDSRGVTVTYDVPAAAANQPIAFRVARSADATLNASNPVGSSQVLPPASGQGSGTLDSAGHSATAAGRHTVTLAIPGGLPPDPGHPYVVVAAATASAAAKGEAPSTASFRTHVIAVISHGGKQPKDWSSKGPPWERRLAAQLLADGYDAVVPYNWVAVSSHAGSAVQQGPRVAADVIRAASAYPANEPVDVHFIGHSEGAVVNSQAILRLNATGWPANAGAGYLKVTMIDPHAANNAFGGKQYSVSNGVLGFIAKQVINSYQSKAKDPLPVVTANVQDAEVFYQHTPERLTFGSNSGIYNLWGQVPVQGNASYYDLTAKGISHAGKFGIQDWYRLNVAPTLGGGANFVTTAALSGAQTGVVTPTASGHRERVEYAGHAAPGVVVRLYAGAPNQVTITQVGRTVAGPDGSWDLTTRPLVAGRWRVAVTTTAPRTPGHRFVYLRPTAWLGPLTVAPPA